MANLKKAIKRILNRKRIDMSEHNPNIVTVSTGERPSWITGFALSDGGEIKDLPIHMAWLEEVTPFDIGRPNKVISYRYPCHMELFTSTQPNNEGDHGE